MSEKVFERRPEPRGTDVAFMDNNSNSSLLGDHENTNGTIVKIDFTIEYRPDPLQMEADEHTKTVNRMEAVCYKLHKVVDGKGSTTAKQMFDRSSWRAKELEYLILLRSAASTVFDQAMKTKSNVRPLWENIAMNLPNDVNPEKGKSAKECQWMWNMLLREYTSVLQGTKEETDFPYFQDMEVAWKYLRKADPDLKF